MEEMRVNITQLTLLFVDYKLFQCRGARHIEVQIQGVLMNIEALVD